MRWTFGVGIVAHFVEPRLYPRQGFLTLWGACWPFLRLSVPCGWPLLIMGAIFRWKDNFSSKDPKIWSCMGRDSDNGLISPQGLRNLIEPYLFIFIHHLLEDGVKDLIERLTRSWMPGILRSDFLLSYLAYSLYNATLLKNWPFSTGCIQGHWISICSGFGWSMS